jgi:hypothetical protein
MALVVTALVLDAIGLPDTNQTINAEIRERLQGHIWNGSAFVAYVAADVATYAVNAPEQGGAGNGSGQYQLTLPGGIDPRQTYDVTFSKQAGGSHAQNDLPVGSGEIGGMVDGKFPGEALSLIAAGTVGIDPTSDNTFKGLDGSTDRVVGTVDPVTRKRTAATYT